MFKCHDCGKETNAVFHLGKRSLCRDCDDKRWPVVAEAREKWEALVDNPVCKSTLSPGRPEYGRHPQQGFYAGNMLFQHDSNYGERYTYAQWLAEQQFPHAGEFRPLEKTVGDAFFFNRLMMWAEYPAPWGCAGEWAQ